MRNLAFCGRGGTPPPVIWPPLQLPATSQCQQQAWFPFHFMQSKEVSDALSSHFWFSNLSPSVLKLNFSPRFGT